MTCIAASGPLLDKTPWQFWISIFVICTNMNKNFWWDYWSQIHLTHNTGHSLPISEFKFSMFYQSSLYIHTYAYN